jgi:hypothetical protein
LKSIRLDKDPLDRIQRIAVGQAFDGGDLPSLAIDGE